MCSWPWPTSSCTTLYTLPSVRRACSLCKRLQRSAWALGVGAAPAVFRPHVPRPPPVPSPRPAALVMYRVCALPEFDGFSKLTMAAIPAGHPIL